MAQGPPYYLTAGNKWLPIYHSPEAWQVRGPTYPMEAPKPPPGKSVYWWLQPKSTWPYRDEMPWEKKSFGAWPSSKITMSDDLLSIWPGPAPHPPWGYIKLKMPGERDLSVNEIPLTRWRIHMRYLSPDEMKVMTTVTPFGPRYFLQSQNWEFKENEYKEYRKALKAKKVDEFMAQLERFPAGLNRSAFPTR